MHVLCPHCQNPIEVANLASREDILCSACGSSFQLTAGTTTGWNPETHQRKLGKFELIDPVGSGAFGTVYKARDPELDRVVAIKIPRAGNLTSSADLDRFLREARSVAQLRHPAIVPVHEVGQQDGIPYLVSDFVQGVTLADLVTAKRPEAREAARIVSAVADALQYAHERGVVHRDVKPSNVILDDDGAPHLMDFGLAKRDAGEVTMTIDGQVLGTPAFMSPEQARGEGHQVDGRSDVYSLGVILYQLLTGELPFRGSKNMLLHQVLHDEPRSPRSLSDHIPRDLETICLKAMAKEPPQRYQSAAALAADLRRFLNGEPIQARPVGSLQRLWRWSRRNPALAGLTAAVAILLLATSVISTAMALTLAAARNEADHNRIQAEENANQANRASADAHDSAAKAEQARRETEASLAQKKAALTDAQLAREQADFQQRQAEASLYFNRIALAHSYWLANNVELAERTLDECPPALHNWEWHYLKRLFHGEMDTIAGPDTQTNLVPAFSQDGKRVASIRITYRGQNFFKIKDWSVVVWDAATGKELLDLNTVLLGIRAVAFSPDGRLVGAACANRSVKIWDAANGEELHTLQGHNGEVNGLAFSPDGKWLATGSADQTIKVWDTVAGKELVVLRGHRAEVTGVVFSPDGNLVASAGKEGTVVLWDVRPTPGDKPLPAGKELRTLAGHRTRVDRLVFSRDGLRLASTDRDQLIKIWDPHTGKELATCAGHAGLVNGMAFSPDGRQLASSGDDWAIKVWDAGTGKELYTLRGHGAPVRAVAYSADGQRLLSVGDDKNLKVWDAGSARQNLLFPGSMTCLAFSPDGQTLVTAVPAEDGAVTVWNLKTGRKTLTLPGPKSSVTSIDFDSKGQSLVVARTYPSPDRKTVVQVDVWDMANPKQAPTFWKTEAVSAFLGGGASRMAIDPDAKRIATAIKGKVTVKDLPSAKVQRTLATQFTESVELLAFSPEGQWIALAGSNPLHLYRFSKDYPVEVWDGHSGTMVFLGMGHQGSIRSVAFRKARPGQRGLLLATGSADKTVIIWEMTTPPADSGEKGQSSVIIRLPLLTLHGHSQPITHLAFSPDGERLASVSCDDQRRHGEVKLWDVSTGQEILTFPGAGGMVAFTPDGSRLAVAGGDDLVRVREATPGRELLKRLDAGSRVTFSKDGRFVATTGSGEVIKIWNAKTWRVIASCRGNAEGYPLGHSGRVRCAVLSPDGRWLASGGDDGKVKIWDTSSAVVVRTGEGHSDEVVGLAFSPDGMRLASASADETARVWDVSSGRELRVLPHSDRVLAVAFSPDRRRLASAGDDKMVHLWDLDSGKELLHFDQHLDFVNSVAFSPDGRLLASASDDQTVMLWDLGTAKLSRTFCSHHDGVRDVAFSPDGKRIASAGWDRTVKVWDVEDCEELLSLTGHTEGVLTVAFGPDGNLASAGADLTLRYWNTKLPKGERTDAEP